MRPDLDSEGLGFCLIGDCTDCEARGGAYVRSVMGGYECVEKK